LATFGYVRVSGDRQDLNNQRLEILEYARSHRFTIDDFVMIEMSSRGTRKQRRVDELMDKVNPTDKVIVSELSRLGRSTSEVIDIVNEFIQAKVGLVAIKQGLSILGEMDMSTKIIVTIFGLLSELERDLISQRTKEVLRAKRACGVVLGRPKGSLGTSKLDPFRSDIVDMLKDRAPKSYIARRLKCSRGTLIEYIRSRGLQK
jgi:putative DNA-invertase from lambdoid prophage Rac